MKASKSFHFLFKTFLRLMKCNDTSFDDIFQIGVFRDKEFTSHAHILLFQLEFGNLHECGTFVHYLHDFKFVIIFVNLIE